MAKSQQGGRPKNSKPLDRRPARDRYWAAGHLEKNKTRRMLRQVNSPYEALAEAEQAWHKARGGRRMRLAPRRVSTGFLTPLDKEEKKKEKKLRAGRRGARTR